MPLVIFMVYTGVYDIMEKDFNNVSSETDGAPVDDQKGELD